MSKRAERIERLPEIFEFIATTGVASVPEAQIEAVGDLVDALEATVDEVRAIGYLKGDEGVGPDTWAWMTRETMGRLEDRLSGSEIDALFEWLEAALETERIREEAIARVIARQRQVR